MSPTCHGLFYIYSNNVLSDLDQGLTDRQITLLLQLLMHAQTG